MVRRVFNFVYREVRGLHQAAYILALFAVGSQVLAIVRDRLLAHTFGAGIELDLYYTAFRIPDLLYVLFASVLSIYVLLPFVNRFNETHGPTAGARVLSQMFTVFLGMYVVVAGLAGLFAPVYIDLLFPGFSAERDTLVSLMRILLLQPFLLGLSTLCGVVTQMNHRFVLFALSPLLYNIGIIIGVAIFYPALGLSGLVWGVVLGAIGHLLIQLPFVRRSRYAFRLVGTVDWPLIRQILAVSIPRALTLSLNQLVLLVLIGMATYMTMGSVSVFQFAFNLQSVPLAIIGMSYSVAAFPTLSYLFEKRDQVGFNRQLLTALRHIIFWALPIIGLVVVLRAQIVRVLLGSGAFDWSDTRLTAAMLAIFICSLFAQAILLLLIRAFYAGGRTLMPLLVALGSGAVSVISAIILYAWYMSNPAFAAEVQTILRLAAVPGTEVLVLAVAFVIGQVTQLAILMTISVRVFSIDYSGLTRLVAHAVFAGMIGAISAYLALQFVVDGVNQETFIGILLQGLVAGIIGVTGVVVAYASVRSPELKEIIRSYQNRILKTDVTAPQ